MTTVINRKDVADQAMNLLSGEGISEMKIKAFSGNASDCRRSINGFFEDEEVEIISISTEHDTGNISGNILVIVTYIQSRSKE